MLESVEAWSAGVAATRVIAREGAGKLWQVVEHSAPPDALTDAAAGPSAALLASWSAASVDLSAHAAGFFGFFHFLFCAAAREVAV